MMSRSNEVSASLRPMSFFVDVRMLCATWETSFHFDDVACSVSTINLGLYGVVVVTRLRQPGLALGTVTPVASDDLRGDLADGQLGLGLALGREQPVDLGLDLLGVVARLLETRDAVRSVAPAASALDDLVGDLADGLLDRRVAR